MFMMSICVCVFVHVHIKQFHVAYSFRDNVSASINRQPIQNLRSLKRGNRSKYSDWLQATKDVLGVLICKETSCRAQPAMQRLQVTKWIKVVTPSRLFPASVLIGKGQPGVELSIELLCIYLASWTHSPSVQDSYKRLQKCLRKRNLKRGLQGVCNGWSWPTRQDLKRVQTSIRLQCIDRMAQYGAHLSTPPGEINQPRFRSMRRTKSWYCKFGMPWKPIHEW
jgi:hypothetical protein